MFRAKSRFNLNGFRSGGILASTARDGAVARSLGRWRPRTPDPVARVAPSDASGTLEVERRSLADNASQAGRFDMRAGDHQAFRGRHVEHAAAAPLGLFLVEIVAERRVGMRDLNA